MLCAIALSYLMYFFFFFSSRRRHTRLQGDWSSDVCSSDLTRGPRSTTRIGSRIVRSVPSIEIETRIAAPIERVFDLSRDVGAHAESSAFRSEERRVGKECRSRWSPYH